MEMDAVRPEVLVLILALLQYCSSIPTFSIPVTEKHTLSAMVWRTR